jgi:hypothetical protein
MVKYLFIDNTFQLKFHDTALHFPLLFIQYHRHGILRECASVARGRFVPNCGKTFGIDSTQGVEASI